MTQFLFLLTALLFQNPSLDSSSPKERQAAVENMALLGNREAIPAIADALKKESKSDLRATMVAALGRIRTPETVPVLAETLKTDLDKDVRLQAIDSILRLYIPIGDSGPIRTIFNRARSLFFAKNRPMLSQGVQVDPASTEALAWATQKDFNGQVRAEAARALGSLRAKDQMPALIAALEDPQNREHDEVRLEIILTMGLIRDSSAGPALERALRDDNLDIVEEAALAIGLVGHKEARPALESLFRNNRTGAVRRRSLEALALLRDPATAPLFESLADNKEHYYREMGYEGLARLDYDATKFNDRFTGETKGNVRNAMAFAFASSGQDQYINDLAQALDGRQAYQAEIYLYELGKFEGKMNELYRYLRSENPKVRAGMARVIGDIGDPASSEYLQALRNDGSVEVVREVVAALRKLNP